MKRSEINSIIQTSREFFNKHRFLLPKWAYWSPEEWNLEPKLAARVSKLQLGWDVTDFGSRNFICTGLLIFCIRNGIQNDPDSKPYAEKILVVQENQETPFHYHHYKQEDIINRGGGHLVLELFNRAKDDNLRDDDVTVYIDEVEITVKAGEKLYLEPGDSITIPQFLYHRFYGAPDKGTVLVGEVSCTNDDNIDNHFLKAPARFAEIQEDEPILHPLWNEVINA